MKLIFVGLVATILVVLGFFLVGGGSGNTEALENQSVSPDLALDAAGLEVRSGLQTTPLSDDAAVARQQRQIRSFRTEPAQDVQLGDEMYDPASPEEVAWRNQNHYPSSSAFESASESFMEAINLDERSPITTVDIVRAQLYATAFPEDPGYSIRYLERAAANGSIYALEALASIYGSSHRSGDFLLSQSYLRAAEIRGNWAWATMRPELSSEQNLFVELSAQNILDEIDAYRRSLGQWPLERDPSPGLAEFLEALYDYLDGGLGGD